MSNKLVQINSLKEMEVFLEGLEKNASKSIESALKAQLVVVKYVNSSELFGTTIDTLFKYLKKSQKTAKTEDEKIEIREKGSILIQNYVFFMQAKLKYAIEDNKKESEEIFKEAGNMLSKSVIDIGMGVASGGSTTVTVAANLFSNPQEKMNLFKRIVNFLNQKEINEKKEEEFYENLSILFEKLEKYKKTIGKSDIISGMIENYKEYIVEENTSHLMTSTYYHSDLKDKSLRKMKLYSLITLGVSILFLVIRFIWHSIQDVSISAASLVSDNIEEISRENWAYNHFIWTGVIIILIVITQLLLYFKHKKNYKNSMRIYDVEYDRLINHYKNLELEFEEEF